MNYLYFLVFVITIPIVFKTVRKYYYVFLNRLYLKNRYVQDQIQPFVKQALKEYEFVNYIPYEYTEIKFVRLDKDTLYIETELFIINKNLTKVNPIERLIKIKGYKVGKKFYTKSLRDSNSRDLGSIIPNVSNIPLNRLFRNRRWDNHKQNWDLYKKDWSIKWMDKPIV